MLIYFRLCLEDIIVPIPSLEKGRIIFLEALKHPQGSINTVFSPPFKEAESDINIYLVPKPENLSEKMYLNNNFK